MKHGSFSFDFTTLPKLNSHIILIIKIGTGSFDNSLLLSFSYVYFIKYPY